MARGEGRGSEVSTPGAKSEALEGRDAGALAAGGASAADSPDVLARFHAALDMIEPIARMLAGEAGGSLELDDLIAWGREGLLHAARRFDPERGVPFSVYAGYRVRGAMHDGMRRMSCLPRRAYERLRSKRIAAELGEAEAESCYARAQRPIEPDAADDALGRQLAAIATGAALATEQSAVDVSRVPSDAPNAEEALAQAELAEIVRGLVRELSANEAELIERHYFEDERLSDIAKSRSMTKFWASRLHARALSRLANKLGNEE